MMSSLNLLDEDRLTWPRVTQKFKKLKFRLLKYIFDTLFLLIILFIELL